MATKDTIEIDIKVGEGVKSLGQIKQEFKDIKKELDTLIPGTDEYISKLKEFNEAKGDVEDLNAEIANLNDTASKTGAISGVVSGIASGFQAAAGAAALFGAESEDVEKALLKIQAVTAFTEGIKGIAEFTKGLDDFGKVAKSVITQLIGVETWTKIVTVAQRVWNAVMAANPIMLMVTAVTALVGAAVLLAKAFDDSTDATERYIQANQQQIDQNAEVIKAIDNEITALSGLKANEQEIIELKRKRLLASLENAKLEALNAQAQLAKDKELSWWQEVGAAVNELQGIEGTREAISKKNSEESEKRLKDNVDLYKKTAAELQAFDNEQQQKKLDKDKENAEKAKQRRIQEANDLKEIQKRLADDFANYQKDLLDKEAKEKAERDKAENDAIEAEIQADFKKFQEDKAKRLEAQKKYEEEVKASNDAIKEAEGKSIEAMQGLSAAFFAFKIRGAKGNAEEELKIRKKQFAVDKAFNIARAIQDGIRSVQAALTIPPPGGQILAGINAAIAAGNVAQIAATQFEGGATSSAGVNIQSPGTFTQAPNVGGGSASGQNETKLNADGSVNKTGQPSVIKAYVVESESAEVTKRVNKLSEQSKI